MKFALALTPNESTRSQTDQRPGHKAARMGPISEDHKRLGQVDTGRSTMCRWSGFGNSIREGSVVPPLAIANSVEANRIEYDIVIEDSMGKP